MGKSAKTYKRATRKEKIGLAATTAATMAASRPIQRHAPISASMSNHNHMANRADNSALSQAASKLLLEAEKRAQRQDNSNEGDDDDGAMEDAANTTTAPKAGKRKSGAGGTKQKASRKGTGTSTVTGKKDYVDMFEGRRKR